MLKIIKTHKTTIVMGTLMYHAPHTPHLTNAADIQTHNATRNPALDTFQKEPCPHGKKERCLHSLDPLIQFLKKKRSRVDRQEDAETKSMA